MYSSSKMSSKRKAKNITTNYNVIVMPYCSPYWQSNKGEG
jgi:hypothetical protein